MSSSISYEYLQTKFSNNQSGFTPEGGIYETFINNTGASSVKGTIVVASTSIDNGVDVAPANSTMPIGIIYENGIANGANVKVVVYGKADVLLKNGNAATRGFWCQVSDTAGRMTQVSAPLLDLAHNQEIGHSLATTASGTNVLSRIQVHFN